jgi:hypothetical protein
MSGPSSPLGRPHQAQPPQPAGPGYPMPPHGLPPGQPPGYGFPPPGQPPPARRKGAGPRLAIAGGVIMVLLIIGGAFYIRGAASAKKPAGSGAASAEKGVGAGRCPDGVPKHRVPPDRRARRPPGT